MQASLQLLHRTANIQQIRLRAETSIGRAAECELRIASSQISRRHCRILIEDGRVFIEDLGSSNGTIVNGVLIAPHKRVELSAGDEITIGPAQFQLRLNGSNSASRIPPLGSILAGALSSLSSTILGNRKEMVEGSIPPSAPGHHSITGAQDASQQVETSVISENDEIISKEPMQVELPGAPPLDESPELEAALPMTDSGGDSTSLEEEAVENPPFPVFGIITEEDRPDSNSASQQGDNDLSRFLQGLG